jgi:hypothetical protein
MDTSNTTATKAKIKISFFQSLRFVAPARSAGIEAHKNNSVKTVLKWLQEYRRNGFA